MYKTGIKLYKIIIEQKFAGGKNNNPAIEKEIFTLLGNGEFDEAEKLARKAFHENMITKQYYNSLITADIPNFRNFSDKPVFGNLEYKGYIDNLKYEMSAAKNAGDRLQSSQANTYMQTRMMKWYRLYHKDEKYILKDGSFDDLKFEDDFLQYFRNMITIMSSAQNGEGDLLFPSLEWINKQPQRKVNSILDKKMKELNK